MSSEVPGRALAIELLRTILSNEHVPAGVKDTLIQAVEPDLVSEAVVKPQEKLEDVTLKSSTAGK